MSEPAPQLPPSVEVVQRLLHAIAQGMRDDRRLSRVTASGSWRLAEVQERAVELGLLTRRRQLTDIGRVFLGEPTHWRARRCARSTRVSLNPTSNRPCSCGSCSAVDPAPGLDDRAAPYYPLSLREGR